METLSCRKIKEQTRDHTTRHLHTWELDLDLLTRVVSDILQEDDTEGLFFQSFSWHVNLRYNASPLVTG